MPGTIQKHKTGKPRLALRGLSLLLAAAMLANDAAYAAPMISGLLSKDLVSDPGLLKISPAFARVHEIHRGGAKRLLIHIEDAHTNLSGQGNLANVLEELITRYGVKTVFVEGASEEVSLSFLRDLAPKAARERVAKKYLMKGEMNGAEYLDASSDLEMRVLGVEDPGLYAKNLKSYAGLVSRRDAILGYLDGIDKRVSSLKRKLYPRDAVAFDDGISRYESSEEDFTRYHALLWENADRYGVGLSDYPSFASLKDLRAKEEKIDFAAANKEQEKLVLELYGADAAARGELFKEFTSELGKLRSSAHPPSVFYESLTAAARARGLDEASFRNLLLYADYLKTFSRVDVARLGDETRALEEAVFRKALTSSDALYLHGISRYMKLQRKLFSLQVSKDHFEEYAAYRGDVRFETIVFLAFLNRRLYDMGNYQDVLRFAPVLDENRAAAEDFYRTTEKRDEAFLENAFARMDRDGLETAALVTGGYHTANLKALLKRRGVSYAVVTPHVTQETNLRRYEELLLSQLGDENPLGPAGGRRPAGSGKSLHQGWIAARPHSDTLSLFAGELAEAGRTQDALARLVKENPALRGASVIPQRKAGARLALSAARADKLAVFESAEDWDARVAETVRAWHSSAAVSDAQRAALERLIDEGESVKIKAGFDSEKGYIQPGTAGARGDMEDYAAGRIGPNFFSETTVVQYTLAFVDWYRKTGQKGPVFITKEVRDNSDLYGDVAAKILLFNGIPVSRVARAVSTPLASYYAKYLNDNGRTAAFGFQISASHNSFTNNGIKFMGSFGQQLMPAAMEDVTGRIAPLDKAEAVPDVDLETHPDYYVVSDAEFDRVLEAYFDDVDATLDPQAKELIRRAVVDGDFRFVFTALNGASGDETTRYLESRLGLTAGVHYFTVADEMTQLSDLPFDPSHPARVRANSDPAAPGLLDKAQALADANGAQVVFGRDPDGDRIVAAVRKEEGFEKLDGNQNALVILEDRLANATGGVPAGSLAMRSHATTAELDPIAAAFGVKMEVVPVGFKFFGAVIGQMGKAGMRYFGAEESYGSSNGHIAEKDGLSGLADLLIAASRQHLAGRTLIQQRDAIYVRYGYLANSIINHKISGTKPEQEAKKAKVLSGLNALKAGDSFGEFRILSASAIVKTSLGDFHDGYDFVLQDAEGKNFRILLRASGTEPLFKAYFSWTSAEGVADEAGLRRAQADGDAYRLAISPKITGFLDELAAGARLATVQAMRARLDAMQGVYQKALGGAADQPAGVARALQDILEELEEVAAMIKDDGAAENLVNAMYHMEQAQKRIKELEPTVEKGNSIYGDVRSGQRRFNLLFEDMEAAAGARLAAPASRFAGDGVNDEEHSIVNEALRRVFAAGARPRPLRFGSEDYRFLDPRGVLDELGIRFYVLEGLTAEILRVAVERGQVPPVDVYAHAGRVRGNIYIPSEMMPYFRSRDEEWRAAWALQQLELFNGSGLPLVTLANLSVPPDVPVVSAAEVAAPGPGPAGQIVTIDVPSGAAPVFAAQSPIGPGALVEEAVVGTPAVTETLPLESTTTFGVTTLPAPPAALTKPVLIGAAVAVPEAEEEAREPKIDKRVRQARAYLGQAQKAEGTLSDEAVIQLYRNAVAAARRLPEKKIDQGIDVILEVYAAVYERAAARHRLAVLSAKGTDVIDETAAQGALEIYEAAREFLEAQEAVNDRQTQEALRLMDQIGLDVKRVYAQLAGNAQSAAQAQNGARPKHQELLARLVALVNAAIDESHSSFPVRVDDADHLSALVKSQAFVDTKKIDEHKEVRQKKPSEGIQKLKRHDLPVRLAQLVASVGMTNEAIWQGMKDRFGLELPVHFEAGGEDIDTRLAHYAEDLAHFGLSPKDNPTPGDVHRKMRTNKTKDKTEMVAAFDRLVKSNIYTELKARIRAGELDDKLGARLPEGSRLATVTSLPQYRAWLTLRTTGENTEDLTAFNTKMRRTLQALKADPSSVSDAELLSALSFATMDTYALGTFDLAREAARRFSATTKPEKYAEYLVSIVDSQKGRPQFLAAWALIHGRGESVRAQEFVEERLGDRFLDFQALNGRRFRMEFQGKPHVFTLRVAESLYPALGTYIAVDAPKSVAIAEQAWSLYQGDESHPFYYARDVASDRTVAYILLSNTTLKNYADQVRLHDGDLGRFFSEVRLEAVETLPQFRREGLYRALAEQIASVAHNGVLISVDKVINPQIAREIARVGFEKSRLGLPLVEAGFTWLDEPERNAGGSYRVVMAAEGEEEPRGARLAAPSVEIRNASVRPDVKAVGIDWTSTLEIYSLRPDDSLGSMLNHGAIEFLDEMKRLGVEVWIISDGKEDEILSLLETAGVTDRIAGFLLNSSKLGHKGDRLKWLRSGQNNLRREDLAGHEVAMIGDNPFTDVEDARRAGVVTVGLVPDNMYYVNNRRKMIEQGDPDAIITGFTDLSALVGYLKPGAGQTPADGSAEGARLARHQTASPEVALFDEAVTRTAGPRRRSLKFADARRDGERPLDLGEAEIRAIGGTLSAELQYLLETGVPTAIPVQPGAEPGLPVLRYLFTKDASGAVTYSVQAVSDPSSVTSSDLLKPVVLSREALSAARVELAQGRARARASAAPVSYEAQLSRYTAGDVNVEISRASHSAPALGAFSFWNQEYSRIWNAWRRGLATQVRAGKGETFVLAVPLEAAFTAEGELNSVDLSPVTSVLAQALRQAEGFEGELLIAFTRPDGKPLSDGARSRVAATLVNVQRASGAGRVKFGVVSVPEGPLVMESVREALARADAGIRISGLSVGFDVRKGASGVADLGKLKTSESVFALQLPSAGEPGQILSAAGFVIAGTLQMEAHDSLFAKFKEYAGDIDTVVIDGVKLLLVKPRRLTQELRQLLLSIRSTAIAA